MAQIFIPPLGTERFTGLVDAPASYAGQAGREIRVRTPEDGLEFFVPPAPGTTSGWELIRTGTFTNDTNITGLDGNADRLWMLVIRSRHTVEFVASFRFNSDSGFNYPFVRHQIGRVVTGINQHAIDSAPTENQIWLPFNVRQNYFSTIFISSISGQPRLCQILTSSFTNIDNFENIETFGAWTNTVDNITTINIITGAITAGEFFLFRRR